METSVGIGSVSGNDGELGVCVDGGHGGDLLGFVGLVVLDDAESIHPEVALAHVTRDLDGVLDCQWEPGEDLWGSERAWELEG